MIAREPEQSGIGVAETESESPAGEVPRGRRYFEWLLGWRQVEEPPVTKHRRISASQHLVPIARDDHDAPEQPAVDDAAIAAAALANRATGELAVIAPPEPPIEALPPVPEESTEAEPAAAPVAHSEEAVEVSKRPTGEVDISSIAEALEESNAITGEFDLGALSDGAERSDAITGEFAIPLPGPAQAEVEVPHRERSFVRKKFHSFFGEIVRFRNQHALSTGVAAAPSYADADSADSADSAASEASTRFREMLQLQAAEAKWLGGDSAGRYVDAQYAMVAFADEVCSTMEWPGRSAWPRHRLDAAFYSTATTGETIFGDVEHLLRQQRTPANRDLAFVYLMVIAAGFRGTPRGSGRDHQLANYRRQLHVFVHDREPGMLVAADRPLFPATAAHTVVGRAVPRVSTIQRWTIALVVLALGYLLISQVLWTRTMGDVMDVQGRIQALR